jgi:hypothetical protein
MIRTPGGRIEVNQIAKEVPLELAGTCFPLTSLSWMDKGYMSFWK